MYEIILINVEFGQVLNEFGEPHIEGDKEFRPKFSSIEDAVNEKHRLLKKFIHAAVVIKNLKTGEISEEYYDEVASLEYIEEKRRLYNWLSLPFYKRLFKSKPVLKFYSEKYQKDDT